MPGMDITSTGTASASPAVVWSVLSDIEGWPRWLPTVMGVERLDGSGSVQVGSRFAVRQPKLGRAEWSIVRWEPEQVFTWESSRPGVRTTGTHVVRPVGARTEIELGIVWSGRGRAVAKAAFGGLTRSYVRTELESLIAAAEARGGSTPSRGGSTPTT